jgi:hypothetical protein
MTPREWPNLALVAIVRTAIHPAVRHWLVDLSDRTL